jgi:hypothetical protein
VSEKTAFGEASARLDLELFASIAKSLAIVEDFGIYTVQKDWATCAFSVVGEDENIFEDGDLNELDKLLHELLDAGLAENSWAGIEEESSEDGDEQCTWYFEMPLLESLKNPQALAELLAKTSGQVGTLSGFQDRKNRFYVYGLERLSTLLECQHEFEDSDSFDEECTKCEETIWDPSEYLETFQA